MSKIPSVTILYGSETGNSQEYSQFLAQRLRYLGLSIALCALDEFPLQDLVLQTKYLVIICSTTGQGEIPRNGRKFMKFILRKALPSDLLDHIKLTTFGLGDSSYPKFNYAIKKLHTRLMKLGCKELSSRCEADEQSPEGLDNYFSEWEGSLIKSLQENIPNLAGQIDDTELLPPAFPVEIVEGKEVTTKGHNRAQEIHLSRFSPNTGILEGRIESCDRITAQDHFQDVRHVIISSRELKYTPGDTVALYPYNDDESVESLIQLQPHWISIADKPLRIKDKLPFIEGNLIAEDKLTLRSLLTHHLDIMSVPTRSFFFTLWHFVDSSNSDGEREMERLREFSNIEDTDLFDYANRPRRLILETILEFQKNLRIPLEFILDIFPIIKPRFFLIASRPSAEQVELVIGIVEYKTIIRRIRKGLCTKWLKNLKKHDKIIFSLQKSDMDFQVSGAKLPPILMILPGLGIAPMKSLIEDVVSSQLNRDLYLFCGFRYSDKDFLFSDLWYELEKSNHLKLFTCFSRENKCKVKYVQDRLFEQRHLVGRLIFDENAFVYLCGSSGTMPRQVRITLCEILRQYAHLDQDSSEKYLIKMEDERRYLQETW